VLVRNGDAATLEVDHDAHDEIVLGLFFPTDSFDATIETRLWPRILKTRIDRELAQTATEIFGTKVDTLQMSTTDLYVGLERFGLRLDSQGGGFRAALRLLMVAAAARGGVLVVEEPECHQHAASLRRLAAALTRQARDFDTQVFLSTHSLECVRAFAECAEPTPAHENGEWPKDVEMPFLTLSLERQEDGRVKARRLSRETVLGLDESGTDVRFVDEYQ
jgi:hypothetical protein